MANQWALDYWLRTINMDYQSIKETVKIYSIIHYSLEEISSAKFSFLHDIKMKHSTMEKLK